MSKQRSRSAEATIRGFIYQFDATILKILEATASYRIVIEGIEDVDVLGDYDVQAVQCKYYEGTPLTNSVLREIVKPMLEHFKSEKRKIKYFIYGYFKSTKEFPLDDPTKFKSEVLAYKQKGVSHNVADDLDIAIPKLSKFLECLNLEYTSAFTEHQTKVKTLLKSTLSCSEDEIDSLYYPKAMSVVERLAVQPDAEKRIITKSKFLQNINVKNALYSRWYLENEGAEKFCRKIRRQYFSHLNVMPHERFLIIEVSDKAKLPDLKSVLIHIGNKLSTASKGKRTTDRFAPFICVRSLAGADFVKLKNDLYAEGHYFVDGYPYKDAVFHYSALVLPQTEENKIVFRLITEDVLDDVISRVTGTKEVFEFYHSSPMNERDDVKHIQVPVKSVNDISLIV